jgi:hypothetical protein
MRKIKIAVIALVILALAVALVFLAIGFFKPKAAGIYIDTKPSSFVYVDNEEIGKTPYRGVRKPGDYTLKLVPESFDKPLSTYETKLSLVENVETVIRREFGEVDELSGGDIISFEEIGSGQSSIAAVSIPQGASLTIDGVTKPQTPYKETDLLPGEHTVVFILEGYIERSVKVKTVKGYQLTIVATLAFNKEGQNVNVEAAPDQKESIKTMVEILSTPNDFLRVRKEPSTLSDEVGKVKPGEKYEVEDEDAKTGWFKIKIAGDVEGWISNEYAKKIEDQSSAATASDSAKLTPTKRP